MKEKMRFLCFGILPGSAKALITRRLDGKIMNLLIAFLLSNISAKKCQNPFIYFRVMACQMWTFL